jgi:hypothetical protein
MTIVVMESLFSVLSLICTVWNDDGIISICVWKGVHMKRRDLRIFKVFLLCLAGFAINLIFNKLIGLFDTPFYFDTIGTIVVSVLGGYVPGIFSALATNLVASLSYSPSAYYGILNVLIAIITCAFHSRGVFKKARSIAVYVLSIAFIGGALGGVITWVVEGPSSAGVVGAISGSLVSVGMGKFGADILAAFLVDIVDKLISTVIALVILKLIPVSVKDDLNLTNWHQTPLKGEELHEINHTRLKQRSLNTKIILVLSVASVTIMIMVTVISIRLFREYTINMHTVLAEGVAKLSGEAIDPEKVDIFLEQGRSAPGYAETEQALKEIQATAKDIEYIYVYSIKEDGCHVVFDLDTPEVKGAEPGEVVPFDDTFRPLVGKLMAGEAIDPLISNDTYGLLLTVYHPVYDASGRCVCYAGADVSMADIGAYEQDFVLKLVSLGLGFFALILAVGIWFAKYHLIYPLNTMAYSANEFAYNSEESMDRNV